MTCQHCGSARVFHFSGKCNDLFWGQLGSSEVEGYPPCDMGIVGSDYVEGKLCLDCGQMQGQWPLPPSKLEQRDSIDAEAVDADGEYIRDDREARRERERREYKREEDNGGPKLAAMFENMAKARARCERMQAITDAYNKL